MTKNPDVRRLIVTAIVGAAMVIAGGFACKNSAFDFPITESFNSLHHGPIGAATNFIYLLFKPLYSVIWAILISVVIMVTRKNWKLGFVFGLTVLLTWLPIAILKALFQRTRPDADLLPYPLLPTPADYSYPSGHTVIITIFVVGLMIVTTNTRMQRTTRVIAPIAILIIMFTVLTVGVHFFTDSLASVIWGLTVTPLVWLGLTLLFRTQNPWTGSDRKSDQPSDLDQNPVKLDRENEPKAP